MFHLHPVKHANNSMRKYIKVTMQRNTAAWHSRIALEFYHRRRLSIQHSSLNSTQCSFRFAFVINIQPYQHLQFDQLHFTSSKVAKGKRGLAEITAATCNHEMVKCKIIVLNATRNSRAQGIFRTYLGTYWAWLRNSETAEQGLLSPRKTQQDAQELTKLRAELDPLLQGVACFAEFPKFKTFTSIVVEWFASLAIIQVCITRINPMRLA